MQVKRFVAADMRRALELVRQQLGPDAIILSSGRNADGVELLVTMGSDNELMQLQQQPLGKIAVASALPMKSDGAWSEIAISERAAKQHAEAPVRPLGHSSGQSSVSHSTSNQVAAAPQFSPSAQSSKTGKSGQQLAEEIERARLRMLASRKVEESAKEFLVGKNTKVNAGIPRYTNQSMPQVARETSYSVDTDTMKDRARYAVTANREVNYAEAVQETVYATPQLRSSQAEPAKSAERKEKAPAVEAPATRADDTRAESKRAAALDPAARQVSVPRRRVPVPRPVLVEEKATVVVEKPKAAMTAAERYPLIDNEPSPVETSPNVAVPQVAHVAVATPIAVVEPAAVTEVEIETVNPAPTPVAEMAPVMNVEPAPTAKPAVTFVLVEPPVVAAETVAVEPVFAIVEPAIVTEAAVIASPAVSGEPAVNAESAVVDAEPTIAEAAEPVPAPILVSAVDNTAESVPTLTAVITDVAATATDAEVNLDIESNDQLQELQSEIADMRVLLEQQMDRLADASAEAPSSPVLEGITRRLERVGLPEDIISKVVSRCTKTQSVKEAWPEALSNLTRQIPVIGRDIADEGGVFAFVGPTGVGKTTTIGKLAARYVLKHGADKVALITTDTYRIAAHDQLRSIARILRVPVRVVDEINTLEVLLRNLSHCPLILIDTAGFRHGDPQLKAQLESLAQLPQIKTLMVLSTNSQAQMMKASVHAYGAAGLQGCVLTKLDETASLGEALGVAIRSWLPVAYTTDGQDIPQNLDLADARNMVSKAITLTKKNPVSAVS